MYQMKDFGKEYNTITYDQRGSGNSSVIKTDFSPADDLNAIMDHYDLKIPTLVIYGDKDSEDIKQIAQLLDNNISNIKTMQIENADHLLNFEKPSELNKMILDFLSSVN